MPSCENGLKASLFLQDFVTNLDDDKWYMSAEYTFEVVSRGVNTWLPKIASIKSGNSIQVTARVHWLTILIIQLVPPTLLNHPIPIFVLLSLDSISLVQGAPTLYTMIKRLILTVINSFGHGFKFYSFRK